jgi:hypothetical protein
LEAAKLEQFFGSSAVGGTALFGAASGALKSVCGAWPLRKVVSSFEMQLSSHVPNFVTGTCRLVAMCSVGWGRIVIECSASELLSSCLEGIG